MTWREFSVQHNATLKDFISRNESRLSKLQEDARIAQVSAERFLVLVQLRCAGGRRPVDAGL